MRHRLLGILLGSALLIGGAVLGGGAILWWHSPGRSLPLNPNDGSPNIMHSPQEALMQTMKAEHQIDTLLRRLVDQTPAISYARVAIVHSHAVSLANMHALDYSVIAGIAAAGHQTFQLTEDQPIWQWRDFLSEIIEKPSCTVRKLAEMTDPERIERLRKYHISLFIACSIFASRGTFLGVLFAYFDRADDLPSDPAPIIARQLATAADIGIALVAAP